MKSPARGSLTISSSLIPEKSQKSLTEYETEMRPSATYATNRADNSYISDELGSFISTPCTSTWKTKNARTKPPAFGSFVRSSSSLPPQCPQPRMKYETLRERRNCEEAESASRTRKNDNPDGSLRQLSKGIEQLQASTIDAQRRVLRAESEVVSFREQLDASEVRHEQKIQEINTKIELASTKEAIVMKLKAHLGEVKKKHQQEVEELKEEHSRSTNKMASAKKLEVDRLTAHILALQGKHQTEVRKLHVCVETAVAAEKEMKTLVVELKDAEKRQDMEIQELREMHIQACGNEEMKTLMVNMTNMEKMHLEHIEELCTEHKRASTQLNAETQTVQTKLEEAKKKHQEEIHAISERHKLATEKTEAELHTLQTKIEETEQQQEVEQRERKTELTSAHTAGQEVLLWKKQSGEAETQHQQEVQELTVKYERAATAEQELEKLKEYILSIEQQHQLEIQNINKQLELAREAETEMKAEAELTYLKAQKGNGERKLIHRVVCSFKKLAKFV